MDEVSRFGIVEFDDFPSDLRRRIGVITEKPGFVPNIFRGLARRPAELRLAHLMALRPNDEFFTMGRASR